MPDLIDTPDSPPAGPVIPRGYATKAGELTAGLAILLAAVFGIFDVDLDTETAVALAGALVTILTVIHGRMRQATAAQGNPAKVASLAEVELTGAGPIPDGLDELDESDEAMVNGDPASDICGPVIKRGVVDPKA